MLAVVVMLAADTKADTTLPLRLRPVAFKLPPVMLPVVDIGFDPRAAKLATTLALPYVAGRPVS